MRQNACRDVETLRARAYTAGARACVARRLPAGTTHARASRETRRSAGGALGTCEPLLDVDACRADGSDAEDSDGGVSGVRAVPEKYHRWYDVVATLRLSPPRSFPTRWRSAPVGEDLVPFRQCKPALLPPRRRAGWQLPLLLTQTERRAADAARFTVGEMW